MYTSSRTRNCRDGGARAGACQSKARYCRQCGICALGIGNDERRAAGCLVYPVIDGVLGPLVYGEGDGADEGYAEKGRPNACAMSASFYMQ
jgi:hypothetical protein